MTHEFYFPFPPSVNSLYEGGSKQKRFNSERYKKWLKCAPELPDYNFKHVEITYYLYFPDKRRRDSKNFLKAIDDWMVKQGLIEDDDFNCLTHETIVPMGVHPNGAGIRVVIKEC